jgi:hypothetical protein
VDYAACSGFNANAAMSAAPAVTRPTDPKIDRWLRRQPPRVELALRYAVRGRFDEAKSNTAFNARVDELFAILKPGEDELAVIVRHSRQIGAVIEQHIGARP